MQTLHGENEEDIFNQVATVIIPQIPLFEAAWLKEAISNMIEWFFHH